MCALVLLSLLILQDVDVETLLKQLSDDSIEARERAAAALVQRGDEEPIRKLIFSSTGELKARCEAILKAIESSRKLSRVLPPLRNVTIDAKDASLIDVLLDLRRQSGMAMRLEGMIDAKVTVATRDAAPLEALDAVCRAANLRYVVTRPPMKPDRVDPEQTTYLAELGEPSIQFMSGYVAVPRIYARHYALTVAGVHKGANPGESEVSLQLRLSWTPETKPESAWIELASVTDEEGRSLFTPAGPGDRRVRGGGRSQSGYTTFLSLASGDSTTLASVKGIARLRYVKEEKSIRFDKAPSRVGTSEEYDGLRVELSKLRLEERTLRLTVTATGRRNSGTDAYGRLLDYVSARQFRVVLEDGSSAILKEVRQGRNGSGCVTDLTFRDVKSNVASIEIVLDTVYHDDSFDFELKNIPLPK